MVYARYHKPMHHTRLWDLIDQKVKKTKAAAFLAASSLRFTQLRAGAANITACGYCRLISRRERNTKLVDIFFLFKLFQVSRAALWPPSLQILLFIRPIVFR